MDGWVGPVEGTARGHCASERARREEEAPSALLNDNRARSQEEGSQRAIFFPFPRLGPKKRKEGKCGTWQRIRGRRSLQRPSFSTFSASNLESRFADRATDRLNCLTAQVLFLPPLSAAERASS